MAIEDPSWPRADQWLEREDARPEVLVVGVPSSSASLTPSQARLTPGVLRKALSRFSTWHSEWEVDLWPVTSKDLGDLDVAGLDMHSMPGAVEDGIRGLPAGGLTLFVGGDNAITRPLVAGSGVDGLGHVGVLTFDAHHDVRPLDRGPTNGTPIRGLLEGGLPGDHVVQVGIHSFANSAQHRRYCDERGVGVVTVEEVERRGIVTVVSESLSLLSGRCDRVHVDVDIDVLDRAFAPGCPGARPGGMSVRALAEAVRTCGTHPAVRSMDFVEVDPERDRDGLTVDALATVFLASVAGYATRGAR